MTDGNAEQNARGAARHERAYVLDGGVRGRAPGAFTIQLILSDGAEEYVLQPTADDARVQLKLLAQGEVTYFDLGRKVLIPSNVK